MVLSSFVKAKVGAQLRPSWVVWGPTVKRRGEGRVSFTDTLCCIEFLVNVSALLNVVGGSVLTWHAGVGHATCMRERPISLPGGQ